MTTNFIDRLKREFRGNRAEGLAEQYLRGRGLDLVERNYRCRRGELDLVMREGATLVFVEVRYRRNPSFGGAAASVDRYKQRRLIAAAEHYLTAKHLHHLPCRFDVLAINAQNSALEYDWLPNAFSTTA